MITFDDSLPALAACVKKNFGDTELREGLFWRDSAGRLSFVLSKNTTNQRLDQANDEAASILGPYASKDKIFFQSLDEFGEPDLFKHESPRLTPVVLPDGELCSLRLIERSIVGVDWNYPPLAKPTSQPPIAVFWSLKGGVGRSTALAVAAAHLSRKGKKILVVDLDLEAPGVGTLLLEQRSSSTIRNA